MRSVNRKEWHEWLERRGEELKKDFTKHALYQAYIKNGKCFLEIWRPDPGQKAN